MNPSTRARTSTTLLAIGLALMGAAVAVRLVLPQRVVEHPSQINEQLFYTGTGSYFDLATDTVHRGAIMVSHYVSTSCIGRGPTTSKSTPACASGEVGTGGTAVWDQRLEVTGQSGHARTLLDVILDTVAFDRATGAAVPGWAQPHDHAGAQVFFFPFGTKQQTYSLWDVVDNHAEPAHFAGVTTVSGIRADEFVQRPSRDLGNFTTDGTVPGRLLGRPGEPSVPAHLIYRNDRHTLVDPRTGVILGETDRITMFGQALDGRGTPIPLLVTPNLTLAPAGQAFLAGQAHSLRHQLDLVETVYPAILLTLGAVALVAGFLLRRRQSAAYPMLPPTAGEPSSVVVLPHAGRRASTFAGTAGR